jgi:hypothetical protein
MLRNVALAVIAGLTQVANAWMGYKVTSKRLSVRQRKVYDSLFIVVGLIGVIAIGAMAYRSLLSVSY